MDSSTLYTAALWLVPVLVAVILHEIAHGVVAYWRGDPTAKEAGRLTLNPLPHIDPIGTILFPALLYFSNAPFLFGYARPVPVNFARLHAPRTDMILVAAAGPLTNIVLAILSAFVLRVISSPHDPRFFLEANVAPPAGFEVALMSIFLNVGLAVFNMLPILPLDGGRVLVGLLPLPLARVFAQTERFGMIILIGLLATNAIGPVTRPLRRWLLEALL